MAFFISCYNGATFTTNLCFGYKDTLMGGNTGAITTFSTLDVDSAGNVVVGGGSNDSSLVSSTSQTAFVVLINAAGNFKWTVQFDPA